MKALTATLVAAAALSAAVPLHGPAHAQAPPPPVTDGPRIDAPDFREVGRVPVPTEPPGVVQPKPNTSGWLILDPATRRGYTLVEGGQFQTVIQSFDLDSLQPRQRVVVPGVPIVAGSHDYQAPYDAGEVIHAVDSVAGRIYLPLCYYTLPLDPHID